MKNKKILSITEARKRIFEIAEDVQKPDTRYILTENGKPKAVIISAEYFDNLMEDIDIYSNPQTMKNILASEEAINKGDYYTWDELKKELGFKETLPTMVAEKPKFKYIAKSKKKSRR